MYQGKTFLAIIPARSGSKRLPHKNIKNLYGKPLIAWSIEAAKKSKYIDEIIVSTDSQEYLDIAKQYGANTPFLRPNSLSTDTSESVGFIQHTIDFYKEHHKQNFDYIVILQPTSPLRQTFHIDEAIELCLAKDASSVVSVCKCEHPPLWSNILPSDLSMENFLHQDIIGKRSQDIEQYYRLNGCIFIGLIDDYIQHKSFVNIPNSYAYIMDRQYSIDIDTQDDFDLAEFLMRKNNQ